MPTVRDAPLSAAQWERFDEDGYLRLGPLLDIDGVSALQRRADDIALGRVDDLSEEIRLQLDTGGAYEELPEAVVAFTEGTLLYRKIQGLEADATFSPLVRHDRIREICARSYGPHAPVSLFRAMVMNKPAGQGTVLPWHQDGGGVWALDRDPLVTVWVALDPSTRENGCLEVVPGSHRLGILTEAGSTLGAADAAEHCPADRVLALEVQPGHGVLLHNWLIHRSGVNRSSNARRAFTACYMDGRTRSTSTGALFPTVFGSRPEEEFEVVAYLRATAQEAQTYAISLREAAQAAETYALSLRDENAALHAAAKDAAQDAAPAGVTAPGGVRGLLSAARGRTRR